MKKIIVLIIGILLFTIVFAAEDPVRIFAKQRQSSDDINNPCNDVQNPESCYERECQEAVCCDIPGSISCSRTCSGGDLLLISDCVHQSLEADFSCINRLTGFVEERGTECGWEKVRDASPEVCEAFGYTNCNPNGNYYFRMIKTCQPDRLRINFRNPTQPYMLCSPSSLDNEVVGCNLDQCELQTEDCLCKPNPYGEGYCLEWHEEEFGGYNLVPDDFLDNEEDYNPDDAGNCVDQCSAQDKCLDVCTKDRDNYCCQANTATIRWHEWEPVYKNEEGDLEYPNPCNAECAPDIIATCPSDKMCNPETYCNELSNGPTNTPDTNGGGTGQPPPCPFLYSITEDGEAFEETIVEGQYSPSMKTPHYTKLDNYDTEVNSILIEEPFYETAYIDNLQLIKINHNALISTDGHFVTINTPLSIDCKSKSGIDCSDMVIKKDANYITPLPNLPAKVIDPDSYGSRAYSTDLSEVNLNNKETYKDYIELTLPNSGKAKLIVSFSLTPNMVDVQRNLFYDLSLPIFYSVLEKPLIKNLVEDKMKSVGYAHVLVQDENGVWKRLENSEFISFSEKETVIVLDNVQNKVRIEFTAGVFAFDYIAVDYSLGEDIEIENIGMVEAVDSDGNNILYKLKKADNDYIVISKDESFLVNFEDNGDGTYFLRTVGYYQPNTEKENWSFINLDLKKFKFLYNMIFSDNYAERYVLEILT